MRHVIPASWTTLARNSLALIGVVTASTSCLVVGEPDFTQERVVPRILSVDPPPDHFIDVVITDGSAPKLEFQFTIDVDQEGLVARLLENYGHPNLPGSDQPYEFAAFDRVLNEPGLGLVATMPYQPRNQPTCKSVTLLVTHQVYGQSPYSDCPADGRDVDMVRWFVATCNPGEECDYAPCIDSIPDGGYELCPDDPAQAVLESSQ